MEIPKRILPSNTKVMFIKYYAGEKCEYTGVVYGNSMDKCMHRTLKDLVYYIIEDGKSKEDLVEIHHSEVFETIECPNCGKDLLEVGVYQPGFVSYHKPNIGNDKIAFYKSHEKLISCMECDLEIANKEVLERLGVYFDFNSIC